jgi:prepilin-type N-terminal cleavage/methylation domain-containing protein
MKKNAFTLIELLIAIIIIGVLAAVSIPMISMNTEKAEWAEALQALGVAKRAMRVYYYTHDNSWPPSAYILNGPLRNCPPELDIGMEGPDADGRYIYQTIVGDLPRLALVCQDTDGSGGYSPGEPLIIMELDGTLISRNGAPAF